MKEECPRANRYRRLPRADAINGMNNSPGTLHGAALATSERDSSAISMDTLVLGRSRRMERPDATVATPLKSQVATTRPMMRSIDGFVALVAAAVGQADKSGQQARDTA